MQTEPRAAWHALGDDEVLSRLETSREGLSDEEAVRRRAQYGRNELPRKKGDGPLTLLWRQIDNPLIWVLLGAALLALVMGKITDGLIVLAVVVLNTLIGFVQEFKAGKAIQSLSQMVPEEASVIRGGRTVRIPAQELVPGDIVQLASGDRVPADLRLIGERNLQIEEAALTGESVPVPKTLSPVPEDAELGDRTSLAFGGTVVTTGRAQAVVVETGHRTELGRISGLLNETVELETPLTRQLVVLGRYITFGIVAVSAVLLPIGLLRGYTWVDALLVAITLAVAAIPEGLPAIVTIALAIGVQRMAARRAIVRQLPAVETLGSTTIICTDKTGTLTRNEMTVQALWTPRGRFGLSGVGYAPEGSLCVNDAPVEHVPPEVEELLLAGTLCNDATLRHSETDGHQISGDPTEAALVVAAEKVGLGTEALRRRHPRLDAVPFESEHQYMATLHDGFEDGRRRILLKGAPEVVFGMCDREVANEVDALARRGMRVLAMASREVGADVDRLDPALVQQGGFELLGLQGMIDPPREEAIAAVRACHEAGVVVKMITGDHGLTAQAIGAELGLGERPAVTGAELGRTDDETLRRTAASTHVFARVAPEHKLRLVRALQAEGHVVAMTGDGVNDAPALKQSNIGVAMGITGTAVAKESADIILTDDNFASITAAVEEGRRVYDNLVKSFAFVLPTNVGLALVLMVAVAFFPIIQIAGVSTPLMPMLPRQILWINLVASIALSLPLAFEVAEHDVMRRAPRPPSEPIFGPFLVSRTVVVAILMAAGGIGLFLWQYGTYAGRVGPETALAEAQTMAVTTITAFQIFYMVTCRALRTSVWRLGVFSNPAVFAGIGALVLLQAGFIYLPFMQRLFGTAPLSPESLLMCVLVGATILPVVALEKALISRFGRRRPPPDLSTSPRRLRHA